jgi:hypothetical protein
MPAKITTGASMAEETKITLEGLVVSSLAMTDALAKLMIAKGVITEAEFDAQLGAERAMASCQALRPATTSHHHKTCR